MEGCKIATSGIRHHLRERNSILQADTTPRRLDPFRRPIDIHNRNQIRSPLHTIPEFEMRFEASVPTVWDAPNFIEQVGHASAVPSAANPGAGSRLKPENGRGPGSLRAPGSQLGENRELLKSPSRQCNWTGTPQRRPAGKRYR